MMPPEVLAARISVRVAHLRLLAAWTALVNNPDSEDVYLPLPHGRCDIEVPRKAVECAVQGEIGIPSLLKGATSEPRN
jgi:hypothetical protein